MDKNQDPFPVGGPLWDALAHAPRPPGAPRLAERVTRQIRSMPPKRPAAAILLRWAFPAAAAAATALAMLASWQGGWLPEEESWAWEDIYGVEELLASSASWAWSEVAPWP